VWFFFKLIIFFKYVLKVNSILTLKIFKVNMS
jgi:hypothetical protein